MTDDKLAAALGEWAGVPGDTGPEDATNEATLRRALRAAVLTLDAYAGEGITIERAEGGDADAAETLCEIAEAFGYDDVGLMVEAMLPEPPMPDALRPLHEPTDFRAILARHGLAVVPVGVLAPIERLPAELPQGMVGLVGWAAAAHDARTALAAAQEPDA